MNAFVSMNNPGLMAFAHVPYLRVFTGEAYWQASPAFAWPHEAPQDTGPDLIAKPTGFLVTTSLDTRPFR